MGPLSLPPSQPNLQFSGDEATEGIITSAAESISTTTGVAATTSINSSDILSVSSYSNDTNHVLSVVIHVQHQ